MNKTQRKRPAKAKAKGKPQTGSSRLGKHSLILIFTMTLLFGFFFAARQHFSSMDIGMKNSRLRKQVDELEAQKRSLLLSREISLSPTEIKKAMKKAGLTSKTDADTLVTQVVSTTKEKAVPLPVSEAKSLVVKTASVTPVQSALTAAYNKTEKSTKKTQAKNSND